MNRRTEVPVFTERIPRADSNDERPAVRLSPAAEAGRPMQGRCCLLCGRRDGGVDGPAAAAAHRAAICEDCVADIQADAVWHLRADLGRRILGQDRAVSVMAAAAYRHLCRERQGGGEAGGRAGNLLVSGPPGMGKTRLIEAAASALDLPLVSIDGIDFADAPSGAPAGLLERLAEAAGRDPGRARFAIVHLDRLDELATAPRPRVRHVDVAIRAQRALARTLGAAASRDPAGALDEVLFLAEMRTGGAEAGPVTQALGLLPELAACFPVAAVLEPFGAEGLLRLLLEPEDGIWNRYRQVFAARGAALGADDEALWALAREGASRARGGWGLREAVDEVLLDVALDLKRSDGVREVRLRGGTFATLRPVLLRAAHGGPGGAPPRAARDGIRLNGSERGS